MHELKQRNMESRVKNNCNTLMTLKLTVENLTLLKELYISHFWFGLHDGNFDTFDLEHPTKNTAEDVNLINVTQDFTTCSSGIFQGILIGLFRPLVNTKMANTASFIFPISRKIQHQVYFSYKALMIQNDCLIANKNKIAHQIFDREGNFIGADFMVCSSQVICADIDENNESLTSQVGIFFSEEASSCAGTDTDRFKSKYLGYHYPLKHSNVTVPNYQIARIKIEMVSVPPQD